MGKGIHLSLEQLQRAKPLPNFYDPEWKPDPETFLWVVENADKWKPKRIKGLHGDWLETPIEYKGYRYDAVAIKPDGSIYLVDGTAHSILYEADGTKTANEIVFMLINEILEVLEKEDPQNPILESFKKGETNDYTDGAFYTHYRHLAMLKKEGLIE